MKRGFTILELLIVLAVTGLLLVLGSLQFIRFGRRQQLLEAADNLVGDLKSAQNLATSATQNTAGTVNQYVFELTTNGYRICQEDCSSVLELDNAVLAAPLCVTGGQTLQFEVPTGNLIQGETNFIVCSPSIGWHQVTVEKGGRIFRGDRQSTACNCP